MSNAQPSTAPGRDAPAAPATTTTATVQHGDAPAHESGGGGIGGSQSWMMLIMFAPIALILFMSRNQSKKQKALEASLKVGDEVVTQSGMLGRISDMDERIVKLEIAPGVKIKVLKNTVQAQTPPEPAKAEKSDKSEKDKDKSEKDKDKSEKDKDKADAKADSKDKSQEKKA